MIIKRKHLSAGIFSRKIRNLARSNNNGIEQIKPVFSKLLISRQINQAIVTVHLAACQKSVQTCFLEPMQQIGIDKTALPRAEIANPISMPKKLLKLK